MTDHSYWLTKLARLRIDTATNAPHKPLLLLVVLDVAQEGALGPDTLPLTPQLAFRFCSYWSIVAHRRKQKPDVRWPFTKLKTEGVWVPLDDHGEPATDPKQARIAKLNADFVAAANDPAFRNFAACVSPGLSDCGGCFGHRAGGKLSDRHPWLAAQGCAPTSPASPWS